MSGSSQQTALASAVNLACHPAGVTRTARAVLSQQGSLSSGDLPGDLPGVRKLSPRSRQPSSSQPESSGGARPGEPRGWALAPTFRSPAPGNKPPAPPGKGRMHSLIPLPGFHEKAERKENPCWRLDFGARAGGGPDSPARLCPRPGGTVPGGLQVAWPGENISLPGGPRPARSLNPRNWAGPPHRGLHSCAVFVSACPPGQQFSVAGFSSFYRVTLL